MERKHEIDHLLETGIAMMAANGYHHTSINDVIKAAGMPKGSFYYLYKDKKEFSLDALDHYAKSLSNSMDRHFANESLSPIEGIRTYFKESIKNLKQAEYCWGCLLGNMAQELSDVDEEFRLKIKSALELAKSRVSKQIEKAQQVGEISKSDDPDTIAELIIYTWHGALIRMKSSRDGKPLGIFIDDFFSLIMRNV